ncbi:response regulator transcription factor [Petrocella sp. FN5]|uniref:response regulator transcription factor n=1 Tax=Petrocella sp. FN5 TaxID=3032002 RepID=UPI0023DCA481|nr:response regulator [Petrocella sp. FN5]MDF1615936.1 response regulator [Petrocella sp. FN5]
MQKILVIDDEKNILNTIVMYLEGHDYNVQAISNGLDGIKAAKDYLPDLILLDLVLPDIDGYLVCKTIKEFSVTEKIPVIIMSAKCQQIDIDKAFDVGALDYIMKPFEPQKLLEKIHHYLKELV